MLVRTESLSNDNDNNDPEVSLVIMIAIITDVSILLMA